MRRNRFEKVDEVQDDAITLEIAPGGEPEMARVHVPPAEEKAEVSVQKSSEPLPKIDAFRGAIKLANTLRMPVVVMGDENFWDTTWGDLYRPV